MRFRHRGPVEEGRAQECPYARSVLGGGAQRAVGPHLGVAHLSDALAHPAAIFRMQTHVLGAEEGVEHVEIVDPAGAPIDRATLLSNGSLRRVWQLQNLKQRDRDGEMSRRALVEYDCREAKNRTLSLSMHPEPMAGGKPLDAYSDPTSPRSLCMYSATISGCC